MKAAVGTCILCLLLIVGAAPVYPSDDSSVRVASVAERQGGNLSGNLERMELQPSCKCADIAHTDIFRSKRLQYVQSQEFAQAVGLLASGASKYSPRNAQHIPLASWRRFATELDRHSATDASESVGRTASAAPFDVSAERGGVCFVRGDEQLIPALVYLASLEYRSWPGHADITPVFPSLFRAGVSELDGRIAEKRRMAEVFAKRAAAIRARIAEAERRGPGTFSPNELARAKSELERAYREASGVRSSLQETDMAFAQAEKVADGLLAR